MKILIAGAGSIGTVLGMLLTHHHEVVLLRRHAPIGKQEITMIGEEEFSRELEITTIENIKWRSTNDLSDTTYDLIVITVQHQHTTQLMTELEEVTDYLIAENTVFLSLQNGMGSATTIQKQFPDHTVLAGAVWWSAALLDQQKVLYHRRAPTVIGIEGKFTEFKNQQLQQIVDLFAGVLQTSSTDDIVTEMRKKLILNVVSPVLALVKQPYPDGLQETSTRNLVHALYDEAMETAMILGWQIDDHQDSRLDGFHQLLITGDVPITNREGDGIHKVSTQLGMEKYGGAGSNIHALLDWLQLSGSLLADEIIQLVVIQPNDYQPIDSAAFEMILKNVKYARCSRNQTNL